MFAKGSQLSQVRPSASASTAYTATLRTEVTKIMVCNTTTSTVGVDVYHDDDGTTYTQATALFYAYSLSGNATLQISFDGAGGGIFMARNASLGVKSSVDQACTFSVYGITEELAQR